MWEKFFQKENELDAILIDTMIYYDSNDWFADWVIDFYKNNCLKIVIMTQIVASILDNPILFVVVKMPTFGIFSKITSFAI